MEVVAGGGAVGVRVTVTTWPSVMVVAEMYGVGIHVDVEKVDSEEIVDEKLVDEGGVEAGAIDYVRPSC